MVRYDNRRDHQTKVIFRNGVKLDRVTMVQFTRFIQDRLAAQRFSTDHQVDRITVRQFLSMLAAS